MASAQSFTLGTSSDPCSGGFPLTIASGATVRFGSDFTCTLTVSAPGMYAVDARFLEPCYLAGSCGAGIVNSQSGRTQNVFVNGRIILWSFSPFVAGSTDSSPAIARSITEADAQNHIIVRVVALPCSRSSCSAVLAGVSITPLNPIATQSSFTGQPCTVPLGQAPTLMAHLPDGTCLPIIGVADAQTTASTSRITADIGTAAGLPSQGKIPQLQVSPK